MTIDRGMKKWNAMMLPEHLAHLHAWTEEQQLEKQPQPLMDWQLTEIEETVKVAYEQNRVISLLTFDVEKWQTITGRIQKIDLNNNGILLKTKNGHINIPLTTIQGAEMDDSFR